MPKRKIKNQESNIKNQLLIKKAKEKIEQEIINEEKKEKKIESQSIINTPSSYKKEKEKDNALNNLIKAKSKSFYNMKMNRQNKQKHLKMNDFRTIDKYINIPGSHSYFNKRMVKINKRNKIGINYISRNSSNNTKMSKYLEYVQENNKNSNKILDYKNKDKKNLLFPSLSSTKNQNKSMTNILFSSKGNFTYKRNNINLMGGKINLFNFDINKIIPRTSSKMDYVPECLLFKNNSALPL